MKHYYIFALLEGMLIGFGCVMFAGPSRGMILALVWSAWKLKATYDINNDEQTKRR